MLVNRISKIKAKRKIDCFTLNPLCATCSNASFCSSCDGGKFGYGSDCVDPCPNNTYNDGVICVSKNNILTIILKDIR